MRRISFLQVNLQHNKADSDVLNKTFHSSSLDIVLIQEPYGDLVRRLTTMSGRLIYIKSANFSRAAMLLKPHLKYLTVTQFLNRDLAAVHVVVLTMGGEQEVIIASAYFPGDTDWAPPLEVKNFIEHCRKTNKGELGN